MKQPSLKYLVLASLFLGMAVIFPTYVALIPEIGRRLLPMHIPVILCGFFCRWKYGLLVGLIAPLLRSILFGMPPLFPIAIAMSFELGAYGLITAIIYQMLPKKKYSILVSLIWAMIIGRLIYGFVMIFLFMIEGNVYTTTLFFASTVLDAIPGIVLQIFLIPPIVMGLNRYLHDEVVYD